MRPPDSPRTFRFGRFELDIAAYQLRRDGRSVRLERQPMDVLILLIERRGQLVSRAEIADRLWGKDVFVDVETGLHTAIRKVRMALRDSAESPVYVETVPGRGYRFIAEVQDGPAAVAAAPTVSTVPVTAAPAAASDPEPSSRVLAPAHGWSRRTGVAAALVVVGLLAAALSLPGTWPGPGSTEAAVTVAVLPFENLSGDPDRDYLADGMTEETIVSLGQLGPDSISVKGRTSAMAYKRTTKTFDRIGRELGADYLVESAIRAEGTRLRITSRLVRVRDQVQVWSASYDREPTSLLGLQVELSEAIAEQITRRLSPERVDTLANRQTRRADAYDMYLRGLMFANQRTPPTTVRAVEYFNRAVALDPQYALAWAMLAATLGASAINGDARPHDVWPQAKAAAGRAIRANPDLPEAQFAYGYSNWSYDWDWPAAEEAFRRAVSIDGGFAWGQLILGHLLSQTGRQEEGATQAARARDLDPLNPMIHALSAQIAFQARDFDRALQHADRAIAIDGEFWVGYMQRGQTLTQLGDVERALDALTTAARYSNVNSKPTSLRGYVLARAGRTAEARHILAALEAAAKTKYVPPYAMALVNAGLEEWDQAFRWLEQAVAARDVHLMFLPVDPKWDPVRTDTRFKAVLARCGFARTAG